MRLSENSDYYNPIMQAQMELSKMFASMVVEDELNRKNGVKVEPDTVGVDFYFLMGFITDEMYYDFPLIEQDFIANCGAKLKELNSVGWYDEAYIGITKPIMVQYAHILRLIYNGCKIGEPFCRDLLKELYKKYHKKEYNQVKKFRTLTPEDINNLADNRPDFVGDITFARIMGMAPFLSINLSDDCIIFYRIYEKKRDAYLKLVDGAIDAPEIKESIVKAAAEQVDKWLRETEGDKKAIKRYREISTFVNRMFRSLGFKDDYDKSCIDDFRGGRTHLTMTLALLMSIDSKREYSYDEVQMYAHIRDLVIALADVASNHDYEVGYLLGEEIDDTDIEESKYKPIKEMAREESLPDERALKYIVPSTESIASTKEDYLLEISELRNKVHKYEQDNRVLRNENKEYKGEIKVLKESEERAETEHYELSRLREFVYESTNEEIMSGELSTEEMKSSIAKRNIVIIGGHPNWHKKLKETFPEWKLIQSDKNVAMDPAVVDGFEKVYFFTGHIGHPQYLRFANYMSKKHIPYGYLADTNIENIIKRVYEDVKNASYIEKA